MKCGTFRFGDWGIQENRGGADNIRKHQIAFPPPPTMSGRIRPSLCLLSVGWGGPNERLLNHLGE